MFWCYWTNGWKFMLWTYFAYVCCTPYKENMYCRYTLRDRILLESKWFATVALHIGQDRHTFFSSLRRKSTGCYNFLFCLSTINNFVTYWRGTRQTICCHLYNFKHPIYPIDKCFQNQLAFALLVYCSTLCFTTLFR